MQITALWEICDNAAMFYGVMENKIQDCNMYKSLAYGPRLRFFSPKNDKELYDLQLFETLELIDIFTNQVLSLFMPLTVTLFVYFQIERAEFRKTLQLDTRTSIRD